MEQAGLNASPKIQERLEDYKSIIPMDNPAFLTHAQTFIGRMPREGKNPDYGEGWYYSRLNSYNESHGKRAQQAIQLIIDQYFPE